MKQQLLNKGEIKTALNLLEKIEYNFQLSNKNQTDDYELYCALEKLLSYLRGIDE